MRRWMLTAIIPLTLIVLAGCGGTGAPGSFVKSWAGSWRDNSPDSAFGEIFLVVHGDDSGTTTGVMTVDQIIPDVTTQLLDKDGIVTGTKVVKTIHHGDDSYTKTTILYDATGKESSRSVELLFGVSSVIVSQPDGIQTYGAGTTQGTISRNGVVNLNVTYRGVNGAADQVYNLKGNFDPALPRLQGYLMMYHNGVLISNSVNVGLDPGTQPQPIGATGGTKP